MLMSPETRAAENCGRDRAILARMFTRFSMIVTLHIERARLHPH